MSVLGKKRSPARKSANADSSTPSAYQERPSSRPVHNGAASVAPVHCTLAPIEDEFLLLPTNVITEVIEYTRPLAAQAAPQWFLGHIDWQNRQVPVFSYAALISGNPPAELTGKTHIMIVKSLSDSARIPYLGIIISDIPRLLSVETDELMHTGDDRKSLGVFCHIELDEQPAVIPDLDLLTHLVTHAAFGILPITQVQN